MHKTLICSIDHMLVKQKVKACRKINWKLLFYYRNALLKHIHDKHMRQNFYSLKCNNTTNFSKWETIIIIVFYNWAPLISINVNKVSIFLLLLID